MMKFNFFLRLFEGIYKKRKSSTLKPIAVFDIESENVRYLFSGGSGKTHRFFGFMCLLSIGQANFLAEDRCANVGFFFCSSAVERRKALK